MPVFHQLLAIIYSLGEYWYGVLQVQSVLLALLGYVSVDLLRVSEFMSAVLHVLLLGLK